MKNIKHRLSAIITLFLVLMLSLALVFSVACSNDGGDSVFTYEYEYVEAGDIADSGITFTGTEYISNVKIGGGNEYHVSAGDISTLKTYLSSAQAGDIIYLAPGTYSASTRDNSNDPGAITIYNSGSYNSYISIVPENGKPGSVVFDFSGMTFDSSNRGIQLNGSYWYIYGINVSGAGDNGMYVGGSYNVIENCQFYNNRDTGLQLGRAYGTYDDIAQWPSYNLIKNCTSYNNYDNETYGENADGFAAKLTIGYGNVFDGCIAYRNSDDGWDLYAYADNGDIGAVIIYNCVAFDNGYLMTTQAEFNASCNFDSEYAESNTNSYETRDGDGNGFKLGGSVMRGNVKLYNCLAFNNRMHGVTDNSNPGVLNIEGVTSYNNGAAVDNDSTSDTFGQIITSTVSDGYGNINTARSESSYNNYKNVLSIADDYRSPVSGSDNDCGLLEDEFLGSAINSIFHMGGASHNYISSAIDASTYDNSKTGSSISITAEETFETLPFTFTTDAESNKVYTYNISGLNNTSIHSTYRNSDGSINMGNILKIKDGCTAATYGVGAYLNESEWSDYTHYSNVSVCNAATHTDSVLTAIYNTLYLYCNTDAVYQDFTLTTKMTSNLYVNNKVTTASISWASSNEDVIEIGKSYNDSNSSSQDVDAIVYRPSQDTQVTLTATITYKGKSCKKYFTVTVKADEPAIGEMYVEGVENGRILVDQYQAFSEPELVVTNAADYNGKTLADGTYTVESTYEYATGVTSAYSTVGGFTSSAAGVYRITKTVTLADGSDSQSYTYYIYVASNDADVDFTDSKGTLTVYANGYILDGDLTNIKGTLYAYSTTESLGDNATVDYITTNYSSAIESYSFTDSSITAYFTNDNSAAYNVYYWFANGNGDVTSSVHTQSVELVEVSNTSGFNDMLSGAASSSKSATIYKLTQDLDFESVTLSNANGKFYALLNGGGHTVSNISLTYTDSNSALFAQLNGGTIMNIRFLNYTVSGAAGTGLIARSFGGYIYQVAIENASITGTDRVGGVVGYIRGNTTYIDQVSVTGSIVSDGNRAGGIIGHVQLDSNYSTVRAEITNCYVAASITAASYVGGIAARFDDTSDAYSLYIANCYVTSDIYCTNNYVGGILGGQSGSYGSFTIDSCTFLGTITYKNEVIEEAMKNASGIVGRYSQYAASTVTNCVSILGQYFDDYALGVSTDYSASVHRFIRWNDTSNVYDSILPSYDVGYDTTTTWMYLSSYKEDSTGQDGYQKNYEDRLAYAPYVVLSFLVTKGWDDAVRCASEAQRVATNIGDTTWSQYGWTSYTSN